MKFDLRRELEKRNLSKADLSRMAGLSRATIGLIEEKGIESSHPITRKSIIDALKKFDSENDAGKSPLDSKVSEQPTPFGQEVVTDYFNYLLYSYKIGTEEDRKKMEEDLKKLYGESRGERFIEIIKNHL